MGRLRALKLGILKGKAHNSTAVEIPEPSTETYAPICPREHDIESLSRLIGKDRKWKMAKKTAGMASRIIGQSTPEGLDDLVLVNALKFHDKECVSGPSEKWCNCHWCTQRREMFSHAND